ncbi:MAG: enoyl-CoA hydratase-related protein [Myxococcota bacterium]|nr:enoyl-CoA hydratase-related protein [Myxococcota bacterium]
MTDSDTLLYETHGDRAVITLNRLDKRNSINLAMLSRFHELLDEIEDDDVLRMVVIRGQDGVFCTGMDLEGFVTDTELSADESPYMNLLKRFASIDKVVVAQVEGSVMAGGVGLVAASDLVFSDTKSTFSLSEVLWGLLPAMVMPFLIRRVGFQNAYRLTLTTSTISAHDASAMNLVDELGDDVEARVQAMSRRISRLDTDTISDLKSYFRKMWIVTEEMEKTAVAELARLSQEPRIVENVTNYVKHGKVPWE